MMLDVLCIELLIYYFISEIFYGFEVMLTNESLYGDVYSICTRYVS